MEYLAARRVSAPGALIVAATVASASIEMPLEGATRAPTHRPSSGAAVRTRLERP
jgi:hypothetical protein